MIQKLEREYDSIFWEKLNETETRKDINYKALLFTFSHVVYFVLGNVFSDLA